MDETGSGVLRTLGCGNQPGWWRVDFAATICRTRWGCFSCIEGDGDGFVSGFVLHAIKIARASDYHSRRNADFCQDPGAVFFINLIQCWCTSPPPFSAPTGAGFPVSKAMGTDWFRDVCCKRLTLRTQAIIIHGGTRIFTKIRARYSLFISSSVGVCGVH